MKTLLVILLTLLISQYLYVEHGSGNPVARVSMAAADSVRWFLHHALPMVE